MSPALVDFLTSSALAFPLALAIFMAFCFLARRGNGQPPFAGHKPQTWPVSLIVLDSAVMALCLNLNRLDNSWWVPLAGAAAWSTISVVLATIYGRVLRSAG
jgi:hypothetical protein